MCDECLNGDGPLGQLKAGPTLNQTRAVLKDHHTAKEAERKLMERQSGARQRNGSPTFYRLLETMASVHDRKSHDYASSDNPSGNYHFAGLLSKLFDNPNDAGFIGRIGEKLYRLANLENGGKTPKNEAVADTELDICVITALWMADRDDRRNPKDLTESQVQGINKKFREDGFAETSPAGQEYLDGVLTQIIQRCDLLNSGRLRELSDWARRYANDKDTENQGKADKPYPGNPII